MDGDRMEEGRNESFSTIRCASPTSFNRDNIAASKRYAPSNTDKVKCNILLEFRPEYNDC